MRRIVAIAVISFLAISLAGVLAQRPVKPNKTAILEKTVNDEVSIDYVNIRAESTGELNASHPTAWLEFTVEPGVYKFTFESINHGSESTDFNVYMYQYVTTYSIAFRENISGWDYYSWIIGTDLDPGEIYYSVYYFRALQSGNIALKIKTSAAYYYYCTGYEVEYKITLEKIQSFENLDTLSGKKSISFPDTGIVAYKLDPGIYNYTMEQLIYLEEGEYEYIYPRLTYSGVDPGEKIEVFMNDTKILTITYDTFEVEKIANPKTGLYNFTVKYTNTTKADNVYIGELYLYYKVRDVDIFGSYVVGFYVYLSKTYNTTSNTYTLSKYNYYTSIVYYIYDPLHGDLLYEDEFYSNTSHMEYIYLDHEYYLIVQKTAPPAPAKVNVSFEKITDYVELNPRDTESVTLEDSNTRKLVLISFEPDHYYSLYLNITNNVNWSVWLVHPKYTYNIYASESTMYNYSSYLVKTVMLRYEPYYFSGPLGKEWEYTYSATGTYVYLSDHKLDDISETSLDIYSGKTLMLLKGYNYTNKSVNVELHLVDDGEIPVLSSGSSQEIELSWSKKAIYEVYKLNLSVFNECVLTVDPKDVDLKGDVSVYVSPDYYMSDKASIYGVMNMEKVFKSSDDAPMILEFTALSKGYGYVFIDRGEPKNDFDGTLTISLTMNPPQETSALNWRSDYGDRLRVISTELKEGKTYRINITKSTGFKLFAVMMYEDGRSVIFMEKTDNIYLAQYFIGIGLDSDETIEVVRITPIHSGKVYIVFLAEFYGEVNFVIEDITPKGINVEIWLPIGFAIGAAVVFVVITVLRKRAE